MKRLPVLILFLAAIFLNLSQVRAEEKEKTKEKSLEAIEFLTGFSWGWDDLKFDRNYDVFPLMVAFDFNLKTLTKKLNFNPRSLLQFQVEPFISIIASPETNIEFGTAFLLKIGLLPQSSKIQPYIKGGIGLDYMSLHTREQSTQFNFTECAGLGVHYFFKKNLGATLEARIRHLSNAGIKEPNHGINAYFALAGISYNF